MIYERELGLGFIQKVLDSILEQPAHVYQERRIAFHVPPHWPILRLFSPSVTLSPLSSPAEYLGRIQVFT